MYNLDGNQSSLKLRMWLWQWSLFWRKHPESRRSDSSVCRRVSARKTHLILITSGSSRAHRECEIHFSHISAVATSVMWKQPCSNPHIWWRYHTSAQAFIIDNQSFSHREKRVKQIHIYCSQTNFVILDPEIFQDAPKCSQVNWT